MNTDGLQIIAVEETPPVLELTLEEVEALAEELVAYHQAFANLYYRTEQAHWGYKYLQGLLTPEIEQKTIQPMAEALEEGNVQAMQQFIGQGRWQDERLLHQHWHLVDETLGEEDGVCILDDSGFAKRGEHSVGVARQWCNALGKVDNCQVGVFAAYASRQGYTLLDRRLYLPKEWFDAQHRARWVKCGIPDEVVPQTKPELALAMLQDMLAQGSLRFRWVTCDEAYGGDPALLDGIAALERHYFAEVAHTTRVWLRRPQTAVPAWSGHGRHPTRERPVPGEPAARQVDEIAGQLKAEDWQAYAIKEGSQGPMVAQFAFLRGVAVRDELPGPEVWVVFRRSLDEAPKLKVYLSNAPADTPKGELVRLAGMRWPIETAIEEGKGNLGMDHYEVRSWLGWHHHMTECILAHHFLVRAQRRLKRGRLR